MLEYNRIDVNKATDCMLTKPLIAASVLFVITATFLRSILNFSQKYVMVVLMKFIIIITTKYFLKRYLYV